MDLAHSLGSVCVALCSKHCGYKHADKLLAWRCSSVGTVLARRVQSPGLKPPASHELINFQVVGLAILVLRQ